MQQGPNHAPFHRLKCPYPAHHGLRTQLINITGVHPMKNRGYKIISNFRVQPARDKLRDGFIIGNRRCKVDFQWLRKDALEEVLEYRLAQ